MTSETQSLIHMIEQAAGEITEMLKLFQYSLQLLVPRMSELIFILKDIFTNTFLQDSWSLFSTESGKWYTKTVSLQETASIFQHQNPPM